MHLTSLGHNLIGYINGDVSGLVSTRPDRPRRRPRPAPGQRRPDADHWPCCRAAPRSTPATRPAPRPTTSAACREWSTGPSTSAPTSSRTSHPIPAVAGGPYVINAGQSLTLTASGASDPEGETLSYSWDVNGDGVFGDATGVNPTLSGAQLKALGIGVGTFAVSVQVNDGYGGSHIVTSPPVTLTVLPILQVVTIATGVTGPIHTPFDAVTVTFTDPITPAALASALSLTVNGGPNLITGPLQVATVAGMTDTYQISGLAALAGANGTYLLTVDASKLSDVAGPGAGTATATWQLTPAPTPTPTHPPLQLLLRHLLLLLLLLLHLLLLRLLPYTHTHSDSHTDFDRDTTAPGDGNRKPGSFQEGVDLDHDRLQRGTRPYLGD